MTETALDPHWTDRAPTMRVLDPLGAESTEGSLQNRLLRPVLSIAITQRLRYLSYWAWVTNHLDQHDASERALYEKVLLTASVSHDCPSSGTGSSGIMGMSDSLENQLDDTATEAIDISPESFTIAGRDVARFDNYYKGILYRLLLFENEWTLSPLGEELAESYDQAIDFSFDEIRTAVNQEKVPRDLLQRVAAKGCLCQLTASEQDLLTKAYLHLISPTTHYEELAFDREPGPDTLTLRDYIDASQNMDDDGEAAIEATLAGIESIEDDEYDEDLDLFFTSGRDAFVRGSLILLLSVGDWVQRRPTPNPTFEALGDSREAWRLLVHAEHASHALQSLFITVMEAVKTLEPIDPDQLLSTLFAHPDFDQEVGRTLAGVDFSEREDGDRSVLTGIRDAVYFGEAPTKALEISTTNNADQFTGTWTDACDMLRSGDPDGNPFVLSECSERVYRALIDETLSEPRCISKCRRVAAYSAVQLARLSSRYGQYFSNDDLTPFVDWLQTAHEDPSVVTCWRLDDDHKSSGPSTDVESRDEWDTSAFSLTTAGFTNQWILNHYFERLYTKIKTANGRSPHLLHVDSDGRLTFDYEINDGRIYNGGRPNRPTLKFDRLGDIFFELDLIKQNDLDEMDVTDRGRQLVAAFEGSEGT